MSLFKSQAWQRSLGYKDSDEQLENNLPLGYHPHTHDDFFVPNTDRYAGTYVLGVQGVGKSGLLENCIVHDCSNHKAVIVIDPHGDLVMHCLARLPSYLLDKVYLLDMEDEAYPFGVNVFGNNDLGTSTQQTQAVDRLMHIFEVLWHDVLKQQYLPLYVRSATIALLANPGSTLVDMQRFLLDDKVRAAMLKNVTDPSVLDFWRTHDELGDFKRMQPLLTRLGSLFMGRSLVRNIVGQSTTSIDFRKAIENKELVFIKLPLKTLAQDARLIGTMLIAQIHAAIFSFTNVPEEERPGVSLYVDEFQNFATPDFSELFTEGRKFGVRVMVAHQYRHQLPDYLQRSTLTARTKVCFQLVHDDAQVMAHEFHNNQTQVRPEDITPHPVKHLLTYPSDNYFAREFTDFYLRPLQSQVSGGEIELHPGTSIIQNMTPHIGTRPNPVVDDPTVYLDPLLYEVMRKGDPDLVIPAQIVYGFSDSGHSFYHSFLHELDKAYFLGPEVGFPPHLAVPTASGSLRWTRLPETGKEQLYHFIFFLRMTMRHLAKEPVGTKSALGTTELAHMLTQLPGRAAWVRSGDELATIYTHPIPKSLTGVELRERLEVIMTQTREKYCRPKTEVESGFFKTPEKTTPDAPAETARISRWEEVE